MKKFSLICDQDHEFEGWFQNIEAVAQQVEAGFLQCPYCGSQSVRKTLSTPHLSTPKMHKDQPQHRNNDAAEDKDNSHNHSDGQKQIAGHALASESAMMRVAIREINKKIEREFTHVGDKFADEARKIHYGEIEKQNIYGSCTEEEKADLDDEGIDVAAIPWLPPDN